MSHFTVMVITGTKPEDDLLERLLQPFHQFECTGIDDDYVVDVDVTAEMRGRYESTTRCMLTAADGTHHSPYEDRFYRDPTEEEARAIGPIAGFGCGNGLSWSSKDWADGRGYRTKVRFVPDGFVEKVVPCSHLMTFRKFVADETSEAREVPFGGVPSTGNRGKHKYGYTVLAADESVEKVIDRTNPNYHWDWWSLGGRWSGFLKMKSGREVVLGEPGVFGNKPSVGGSDMAMLGDIDVDGMRDAAGREAGARYDLFHAIVGADVSWETWGAIRDRCAPDYKTARQVYGSQDVMALLRADERGAEFRFEGIDEFLATRDAYVQAARNSALSTHAVLMDGQWFERGSMGWWGAVSNDSDDDTWNARVAELLSGLSETAWLSIVDCHI